MIRERELDALGPALPGVARRAIAAYLVGDGFGAVEPGGPAAPVFVTLRDADGELRGCIGTVTPTEPDVVRETARSAVLAATQDPRFPPVAPSELPRLIVEVSVLGPAEPVSGDSELDPARYGVIVRDPAGRRGLLLPDIEGVHDAATQVAIARRKAGIAPGSPVQLSRFAVRKWTEMKGDGQNRVVPRPDSR